MENETIIVLDEGFEDSPMGPQGSFCCAIMYLPF
jgi:hypothetical protein